MKKEFDFFGIKTIVKSEDKKFLEAAEMNLYFFREINSKNQEFCQKQELEVSFSLNNVNRFEPIENGFSKIGNHAYIRGNQYMYFDGTLTTQTCYENHKLTVSAQYNTPKDFVRWLKRFVSERIFRNKIDYFRLVRKLIIFPVFWLLEKKNNVFLLHGSAVEYEGKGIIIAGLAGAGKSTGALSLTLDKNARFLTDNFLLFDEEYIYPFPELIRLSDDAKKLIKNSAELGEPVLCRYGRKHYQLKEKFITGRVSPRVLLIPRIVTEGYVKNLAPDIALDRLLLANEHVKEFQNYDYMGLLDYLIEDSKSAYKTRINSLEKLLSGLNIYELGICKSDRPADYFEAVIRSVLGHAHISAEIVGEG